MRIATKEQERAKFISPQTNAMRLFATAASLLPAACRRAHAAELTTALGWVPDVEYADLWAAIDKGFIAEEGLRFHYLPGGPNAPAPVLEISAREATPGDSDWLPFVDAVTQGNDFVILASLLPFPPTGLISLPAAPVRTPADLPGKRFLVQGPDERAMLEALFGIHRMLKQKAKSHRLLMRWTTWRASRQARPC